MDFVCSSPMLCQKEHRHGPWLPKIMSFSTDLIIEDIMREGEKKCVCMCVRVKECPIFFVIALGAGHIHPQHCNLLFTPLPGKKMAQSVLSPNPICFLWHHCHFHSVPALRTALPLPYMCCAVYLHVPMLTVSTLITVKSTYRHEVNSR